MKISVSSDLCQGHARCVRLCPEVFDVDREGFVVLLREHVGDDLAGSVRDAADNCPERAISISDQG